MAIAAKKADRVINCRAFDGEPPKASGMPQTPYKDDDSGAAITMLVALIKIDKEIAIADR